MALEGVPMPELSRQTLGALKEEYAGVDALEVSELVDLLHRTARLVEEVKTGVHENSALVGELAAHGEPSWANREGLDIPPEQAKAIALQMFKSSRAKPGDTVVVVVSPHSKDIAEEVIRLCMESDVQVRIDFKDYVRQAILAKHLPDSAEADSPLKVLASTKLALYEQVGRLIRVDSSPDPKARELGDPAKSEAYSKQLVPVLQRLRSGDLHYILTLIPTPSDAELDGLPYDDYLKLFLEACDQPWDEIKEAQYVLKGLFDQAASIRIKNSDGTDVTLDVRERTFANSVVLKNLPGSEIFSAPNREGVNGTIVAKGRFQYKDSGVIEDITLVFENGRVVDFDARVGKEDLARIIAVDDDNGEGSRHVGEIGIGTNPHLRQHLINGLLVEKIGGSFHVALGSCYSYTSYDGEPVALQNGNKSEAGVHWDLTTILRGKEGTIELDFDDGRGYQVVQTNGDWQVEGCEVLNKGWGALPEEQQPTWWKERYPEGYVA